MAKDEIKKVEGVEEVKSEEKPTPKPVPKKTNKKTETDKFILRKLKALNQMNDKRKAKELADRVMRNSRRGIK